MLALCELLVESRAGYEHRLLQGFLGHACLHGQETFDLLELQARDLEG